MLHSLAHSALRPLVVAFVVFLLAAVAAASLIWRLEHDELLEQRARASNLAIDHAHALQRGIERALSATYALAALVRQGNGTISNFDAVGHQLLPLYPGVSSVSLAPAGVIRRVVPLDGNERAIGIDLLAYAPTKKEASIARDTGTITLAGPFNLLKGKSAAIGRLPIFLDDAKGNPSFWGFINVEISLPKALEVADLHQLSEQGYDYALWRIDPESGQKLTIAASSSTALNEPQEHALEVPNATWTLSIVPLKGWGNPLGLSLKMALGLFFSLLLGFMAKLLVDLRVHKQGLEALVAHRTAEVQAREADLNRAQAIARVGSWVLDLPGTKVRWSAETFRIIGVNGRMPPDHETFLQHVHPEDRDAVERAWHAALNGARYDVEYRFLDGASMRWVHGQAKLQIAADGRQRRYVGTVQDITEHKRAEQALARESHRNQAFLRNASDGVHILDADGNVLEVSDSFCQMLGYSREELIGVNVSLWDAQWSPQELRQVVAEEIAKDGRSILQTKHRRRDGSLFDVEITGQRLELDGRPVLFNSARDITERIRIQDKLRRLNEELERRVAERTNALQVANQELEAFSYSVSHDLRAPLRAIHGFSHILQQQYAEQIDVRGKDMLWRVGAATEKMGQLIDDLLKLSKISRQQLQIGPVDLSALASEVVEELKSGEPARKVVTLIAPQLSAQGDRGLLKVMLQNLIDNAWKYSSKRDKPHIEFGAAEKEGQPAYFVRDNGAGFDMAYADKLFGAFQRLHSPAEFPGTGIGLATVARIVRRHGGEVWAEGRVGEGASFYFTL